MKVNFGGKEMSLLGDGLNVQNKWVDFKAMDQDLNEFDSKNYPKVKLILGIPSVDTSVCSLELSKLIQKTKDLDMHLIAISMDLPFAQQRWCQAHASDHLMLVSDYKDRDFANKSQTLIQEVGLLARSAWIVDENQVIRYKEIVQDTGNEPNYEAILNCLNELLGN